MRCNHKTDNERVWYPGGEVVLRPTPVCSECGSLKNVSMDRGRGIGVYINILADMKRSLEKNGFKVSNSQIRLIVNEIKKVDGFDDVYWIKGSVQKSIFIKSVQKFVPISAAVIGNFIQPS